MTNLLIALWLAYKEFVGDKATNSAFAVSERKWPDFFKESALMLAALFAPVLGTVLLLMAVNRWKKAIMLLVMFSILVASYRMNHPGNAEENDGDTEKTPYERASELYPVMLSFMFKVMVAASESSVIDRKHNVRDIKVTLPSGENFSMKNGVGIYPFEVNTTDEITIEQADELRDKLQEIGRNYISDFPQLISTETGKLDPFEVLAVQPLGKSIHVDVILRTSASIPIIDKCRKARVKRQNNPTPPPRYTDPIYGEEEDGTDSLLR